MSYAIEISETGRPDVLTKGDRFVPTPAAGEILIRNHSGAVNFIDTIIRRGRDARRYDAEPPSCARR